MKTTLLALFTLLSSTFLFGQKPVQLTIHHLLGEEPFLFHQTATNNLGHTFSIDRLQYYLAEFRIVHDGGQIASVPGFYALVNAGEETTLDLGWHDIDQVEAIQFGIGVNQPENNADPSLWPAGHPLAPSAPSMHWGWAAGYRFVALEGLAGINQNTSYEFHALGNQNYLTSTTPVTATLAGDSLFIELNADYTMGLHNIEVEQGPIVHGDAGLAVTVLLNFRSRVFSATPLTTSTATDPVRQDLRVFPNPTGGELMIQTDPGTAGIRQLEVFDVTGQQVYFEQSAPRSECLINLHYPGLYILRMVDADNRLATSRILVR